MIINFPTLKGLTIPEGNVEKIADESGAILWSKTRLLKLAVPTIRLEIVADELPKLNAPTIRLETVLSKLATPIIKLDVEEDDPVIPDEPDKPIKLATPVITLYVEPVIPDEPDVPVVEKLAAPVIRLETVSEELPKEVPTLVAESDWYSGSTDKSSITVIYLVDSYTPTGSETESWSAAVDGDGNITDSIKCYVEGTKLTIAGNGSGKIYANSSSYGAFRDFDEVTAINGISLLDTANVTSMVFMFEGCSSLTNLDLSSFNTTNVTNMAYMFWQCGYLTSLDLSSFNTANVTNMSDMFHYCSKLKTIYVSSLWSTAAVTSSRDMFAVCSSLVGGNGTTYNGSYVTKTYAVIDGKDGQPGYLTDIADAS